MEMPRRVLENPKVRPRRKVLVLALPGRSVLPRSIYRREADRRFGLCPMDEFGRLKNLVNIYFPVAGYRLNNPERTALWIREQDVGHRVLEQKL